MLLKATPELALTPSFKSKLLVVPQSEEETLNTLKSLYADFNEAFVELQAEIEAHVSAP